MRLLPVSVIMKWSRALKKIPQPMAANRLQNRHVDISAAEIAMAKPNDQMNRVVVSTKKSRFVADPGFV
jgi:hypothetical protein